MRAMKCHHARSIDARPIRVGVVRFQVVQRRPEHSRLGTHGRQQAVYGLYAAVIDKCRIE